MVLDLMDGMDRMDGMDCTKNTCACARFSRFSLFTFYLLLFTFYLLLSFSASAQWFFQSAADLDVNGDGVIRIALISPPQHSGIDAAAICTDLENTIKASKAGKPVRVTFEPVAKNRTLLGWWYNPDTLGARTELLEGGYDYMLLAEAEDVVRTYPELFFEGVRVISEAFSEKGSTPALLMMAKPISSFRDKRLLPLADTTWRVADGCGLPVLPAAFGWLEALTKNRIAGDHPQRLRANAFMAAQTVYCGLADARVPKGVLDADWAPRKTVEALAESVREAVQQAKVPRYYAGPFMGAVRMEGRSVKRLGVYLPSTIEDDPVRVNFQYICEAAAQDYFIRSTADWHTAGFDRASVPFDLVFADLRQMTHYLDPEAYTSSAIPTNQLKAICTAVFCRTPESDTRPEAMLRNLEKTLIEGYDFARANRIAFIPYQAAWARAWQRNPGLVEDTASGAPNDWLTYMLANMIYTTVTGRCQPVPERDKPHLANAEHPYGYHAQAARIGYETIRQLATLSTASNTLLLRTTGSHIGSDAPGFVGLRLLNPPAAEVTVHCALDLPKAGELSVNALTFTPETFDIEQTVRITVSTNTATLFARFMANAISQDKAIDASNDNRLFIFNYREDDSATLTVNDTARSPATGFTVSVVPSVRPVDPLTVRVQHRGITTEEITFTPQQFAAKPIRLYPTAHDYANGTLQVAFQLHSADRRFNGRTVTHTFRISANGHAIPNLRITSPAAGETIDGPAFVTARAEATPADGISATSIFMGNKRLGSVPAATCTAAVEQGPPQSRLSVGGYTLWAAATTTNGLTVATPPVTFTVREATP